MHNQRPRLVRVCDQRCLPGLPVGEFAQGIIQIRPVTGSDRGKFALRKSVESAVEIAVSC